MEETMLGWKAALVVFFTAIGELLGWRGIMMVAWVAAMALDYLSGTMAACKEGKWSSAVARQGLWHKGGMILVVMVSGVSDLVMGIVCQNLPVEIAWPGLILPLVLAWYVLTELGSILENAVKMGAKVPDWLLKLLYAGAKAIDAAADVAKGNAEKAAVWEEDDREYSGLLDE